jgi:hypothetical protein
MANAKIWSNVQVGMESVTGTSKTITAINTGTAEITATHDYTTGDWVKFTNVGGTVELNGRVFRVLSVTGTTAYVLEGAVGVALDMSAFGAWTSGGVSNEVTFGTSLGTAKGLSGSGGDFNFINTTTIHDTVATQIPGLASPIGYNFEHIWDVADAGLLAMKSASDAKSQKAFKFTFADGAIMVFNGYVGCTLLPGGSAQDLVTTQSTMTMFGVPTYYAS